MTPQTPWTRVDLEAVEDSPPQVPEVGVVLARVTSGSLDQAGSALLTLARGWRASERRVFLCDACFETPFLHAAADLPNAEGLADALLYGTSFQRIARRLDRDLHLATAGTVVPDPELARAHPRWTTIVSGFEEAGALLVIAIPDDAEEGGPLDLPQAIRLRLGETMEGSEAAEAGDLAEEPPVSIEALFPDDEAEEVSLDADLHDLAPDVDGESHGTDEGVDEGAELDLPDPEGLAAEPMAAPPIHEERLADPPPSGGFLEEDLVLPPKEKSSGRVLLLILLLIVVGALAAAWYGFIEIPGITPADADAGQPTDAQSVASAPVAEAVPAPPAAQPVEPIASARGWVLALGSFPDRSVAARQVESLRERAPELSFLIVPVSVDGQLFNRVLAGPTEDSLQAESLREELDGAAGLAPAGDWMVRSAPLAFQLGETTDLASAERRVEVLEGLAIATHLMEVPFSDGTVRYRVYAGAFADESESSGLRARLSERGLANPPLVERIGRRPE